MFPADDRLLEKQQAFWKDNYQLHCSWLQSLYRLAEPAFEERKTSDFLVEILNQYCPSLSVSRPFHEAPTAVIAVFEPYIIARQPILLRADMDALPMKGASTEPQRIRPEIYHGCGHNGHMTCLLAAAHYIHCFPEFFSRKVVLLFQPAEESSNPKVVGRRGSGAKILLDGGLLSTLHEDVKAVYALHCWPGFKVGDLAIGVGPIMGTSSRFEISFRGDCGHAAQTSPQQSEPLLAACATVTTAQGMLSRSIRSTETATVAFTKIMNVGSEATNVCPNEVVVYGTARSFSDQVILDIRHLLNRAAEGVANAYGCSVDMKFLKGFPVTTNGVNAAKVAKIAANAVHDGKENSVHVIGLGPGMQKPSLCSEDFSFFARQREGAYVWLGNGAESSRLHTKDLLFNDDAIEFGGKWFVEVAKCVDADLC